MELSSSMMDNLPFDETEKCEHKRRTEKIVRMHANLSMRQMEIQKDIEISWHEINQNGFTHIVKWKTI